MRSARRVLVLFGLFPQRRCDLARRIHQAKLDLEKVLEVRALYQRGVRGRGYVALAKQFSVDHMTIRKIVNGETWKHAV